MGKPVYDGSVMVEPVMKKQPSYVSLYEQGELEQRVASLEEMASSCTLCPHRCGVDRRVSRRGRCRSGLLPIVSSAGPHLGEERPLVADQQIPEWTDPAGRRHILVPTAAKAG